MSSLRLPKSVEEEIDAAAFARDLEARSELLWKGASYSAAPVLLGASVKQALAAASSAGRVTRGFEGAKRALAGEAKGLRKVDQRTGVVRGARVSRLLVITNDGAERFYRNVESLLRNHSPRVFAIKLNVDEAALGTLLFGDDDVARLVLLEHKEAVAALLLAGAAQWQKAAAPAAKTRRERGGKTK